jgi:hypothetical protein
LYDAVTAEYVASHDTLSNFIEISSDSDDDDNSDALITQSQALQSSIQPTIDDPVEQDDASDSDEFVDIDVLIARSQARSQARNSSIQPTIQSPIDSDEFVDIDVLIAQSQAQYQPPTSSNHPIRTRKPTAKQASQNRRAIEREEKRLAKLSKKPKTVDTTQLDDFELPFRSSQ